MTKLLVAATAAVSLLVALAAPAAALTVRVPNESHAASTAEESIDPAPSLVLTSSAESDEHGDPSRDEEDGTDLLTFLALLVGGIAVTLALAALVRAGRRIPQ